MRIIERFDNRVKQFIFGSDEVPEEFNHWLTGFAWRGTTFPDIMQNIQQSYVNLTIGALLLNYRIEVYKLPFWIICLVGLVVLQGLNFLQLVNLLYRVPTIGITRRNRKLMICLVMSVYFTGPFLAWFVLK